jgi:hypothetical protein
MYWPTPHILISPARGGPMALLEWPAMLRLLAAQEKNSGYPPYWQ